MEKQQQQQQQKNESKSSSSSSDQKSPLPGATLPKGGGAIRGMGEKFQMNPVTGTASVSVPILTSPGRDGFNPSVGVSYDSASGNGPFGFGWSLNTVDSITRKTSRGLPRYQDDDIFLMSGAEDLVPLLRTDGSRHEDKTLVPGYIIHRYRLRIEGSFSRIERWTNLEKLADVHWRLYSPDDVLSIYGRSDNSRIFNPEAPEQIFSWLLSDSRDWKGNAIVFEYKAENGEGVDLTKEHQRNRGGLDDARRKSNRYIKSVNYGNQKSFLDDHGKRNLLPSQSFLDSAGWLFEVVFDYGEHAIDAPTPVEESPWSYRSDAFSSYRSGFEVRTSRICRRVLMFHHFPDEPDVGMNCLVRSTDFIYQKPGTGGENRVYTFLDSVEQSGFRRRRVIGTSGDGIYIKRSMPRLEFKYSELVIDDRLKSVDPTALENAPVGLASEKVQWIDLYGEGISGILTRENWAWYYKRNITPLNISIDVGGDGTTTSPMFDVLETIPTLPKTLAASNKRSQFADLTGDGFVSIITDEEGSMGFYRHIDGTEEWATFEPFEGSIKSRSLSDPSVHLLDLTGDGTSDAFMPEDALWYPSVGPKGFGAPERFQPFFGTEDDACGPIQLFCNDLLGTTHLADFTGDGLTDIVRICNGEVSVWPNLGYGKFGAKITMDNAPVFDDADSFDADRIILADIDGSGTTDILYLHRDGVRVYFNELGNSWSSKRILSSTQYLSEFLNVATIDIHGNGTTCLVISNPLPASDHVMQYIDLMGSTKPHLLTQIDNNLGLSTQIEYSTSTNFYLRDKKNGKPWISRLAYPIHVVAAHHKFDHISRNKFTSRFAYHHGHYDGLEREFRGFGMVEQWDTEEFSPVHNSDDTTITNSSSSFALPPVHTKSWFHQGKSTGRDSISKLYEKEYFQDPRIWTVPDTVMPLDVTVEEEYDACRALKGALLRQEVYNDDAPPGSSFDAEIAKSLLPVKVVETNFTLTRVQSQLGNNISAVFFTTPRERIVHSFERDLDDPRISHSIILKSNEYGQTIREAAIGYGRRKPDDSLPTQWDKDAQTKTFLTYSENKVTNDINDDLEHPHCYRAPVNCQSSHYELTGFAQENIEKPFTFDYFFENEFAILDAATEIGYEILPTASVHQKRILKCTRTVCRRDDFSGILPLGEMGALCIPGQSYSLAFTSAIFDKSYQRDGVALVPNRDGMLTSVAGDGGGFLSSANLKSDGIFPSIDTYDGYWISGSRGFYSNSNEPTSELAEAQAHFYRLRRAIGPFGAEDSIFYDPYDLLIVETRSSIGNTITVGERDEISGTRISNGNDYRLIQPRLLTDPNGNRAEVKFDALGQVTGSAMIGKRGGENVGDTLVNFEPDLPEAVVRANLENPTVNTQEVLQGASSRIIYDLFTYVRTKGSGNPQPCVAYSIDRVTHEADLAPGEISEMHHTFAYSDGLGRAIQSKSQREPGPVAARDAGGRIILNEDDQQPVLTDTDSDPRWITSGWVIYNNKGLEVRRFDPWFTHLHTFEFDMRAGNSPVFFYDTEGRAIAVLAPDASYIKSVFTPWRIDEWDPNDTVEDDPRTDPDVKQWTASYFKGDPKFKTWLQKRINNQIGILEKEAAEKAKAHARTPIVAHLDSLGRVFLKSGHNRVDCPEHELNGQEWRQYGRVVVDIEGQGLQIRDTSDEGNDPLGRIVESYVYDMRGRAMVQNNMDSGQRIWLTNALGQPIYQWDDRGHRIKTTYDQSGRVLYSSVLGDKTAPGGPGQEVRFNAIIYGEYHPQATERNLRGTAYMSLDQAGVTVTERKDFKGNLLQASKRFNIEYKTAVDWSIIESVIPTTMPPTEVFDESALRGVLDSKLHPEIFTDRSTYDAQNRLLLFTAPNSDGKPSTTRFTYNVTALVRVASWIRTATTASGAPAWTPFIDALSHDARGLRTSISYANGITTSYTYSSTGDLKRLLTTRGGGPTLETLQDLQYTYDANRLHTNITDTAQQTLYFRNTVVTPSNDYTYDALYQLVHATGREHLSQPSGLPTPHGPSDETRRGPQPGEAGAMGRYAEWYTYDRNGNIQRMRHDSSNVRQDGAHSWTRTFAHRERSTIEPTKNGNRLTEARVGREVEELQYDRHGNMTRMPQLGGAGENVQWDFQDRTRKLDLGGGGTAYYIYDRGGRRVRKVIERAPGLREERLCFGSIEIYRRYNGTGVKLERETLHVLDDSERIALVETRTIDIDRIDRAPEQVIRFQLTNHLKSASIEVDAEAKVLTYEEFSPYGNSTYIAAAPNLELPKRYRFTGKEHDTESSLSLHGARFYSSWLCRWTPCDPSGTADTLNVYQYASSNPIAFADVSGSSSSFWDSPEIKAGRRAEADEFRAVKTVSSEAKKEVVLGSWVRDSAGKVKWVILKRLDIVTKELAIQVKWVGVKVDAVGNLIETPGLHESVLKGIRDAREEIKQIAEHAARNAKGGWQSKHLVDPAMWGPGGKGRHILRFVADAEPKVVNQLRDYAQNAARDIARLRGEEAIAIEAVVGTGTKAAPAIMKAASHSFGIISVISAAHTLATAESGWERALAGVELAAGIATFIPALAPIGLAVGAAIGIGRLGFMAWKYFGPGSGSSAAAPPPPSVAGAPTEPTPAPEPAPTDAPEMTPNPAPAPAPAAPMPKKGGGGGGGHQKQMVPSTIPNAPNAPQQLVYPDTKSIC